MGMRRPDPSHIRLPLTERVQSVLEVFVLDPAIPDEEYPLLRVHADLAHKVLAFPRDRADEVHRELVALANAEDDRANPRDEKDPEMRAHARYGRDAISALSARLAGAVRSPAFSGDGSPSRCGGSAS